jgi:HPt (histidine-containing phosphotransfer) domain-containing protein
VLVRRHRQDYDDYQSKTSPALDRFRRLGHFHGKRQFRVVMKLERPATGPVFDLRGALARLDGDEELLADLFRFFLEDSSRLLDDLQSAIAVGDFSQVKMSAHALKGLVAGCGGVRAAETAKQVELAADAGDCKLAAERAAALASEVDHVRQEAEGYLR